MKMRLIIRSAVEFETECDVPDNLPPTPENIRSYIEENIDLKSLEIIPDTVDEVKGLRKPLGWYEVLEAN